jgi:predicted transcriptional regulator of viral defense system
MGTAGRVAPRHLRDYLLSQGRPVVDLSEVAELTGLSLPSAVAALARLRQARQMFSPHPGLYLPVPPQYMGWGTLPAADFIDPLMTALGRRYYVGLLSAAELHGAAHQRPQVFQVLVDQIVTGRDFGRVELRFYARSKLTLVPTTARNTATGQLRLSTPAATGLDLARRPLDGGGLSNVATVLAELVGEGALDAEDVRTAMATGAFPTSALRRLGWLLEFVQADLDTELLYQVLRSEYDRGARASVLLDASGPRRGQTNSRWGVVENAVVEPDL